MKAPRRLLMVVALLSTIFSSGQAAAQERFNDTYAQITNIQGRKVHSLDGMWKYIVDLQKIGYLDYRNKPMPIERTYFMDRSTKTDPTVLLEYDFDLCDSIAVPGDWNTQKERLYYYEGAVWYRKKFSFHPENGKRYFLYFGAVNYEATVGLNGQIIGHHKGGFTPFDIEITDKVKDGVNSLVVLVDNTRKKPEVPTDISDWWNYGGITRSVGIVEVDEVFVRDYSIQIEKSGNGCTIYGWVETDGGDGDVSLSIPELGLSKKGRTEGGRMEFSFAASPVLWCPENPKLYDIAISYGKDVIRDKVGFRFIETKGDRILLNGKEIFCKGVCIHEEQIGSGGRIVSKEQDKALLDEAAFLGCNFVRLAHYPHNEDMVRLAEEMGIMVWSEVPVYWTIDWTSEETYRNALTQLEDNITRDKNRCNIIIWSVANETPISEERTTFLSGLIDRAHEMDPTRLVSCAMEIKVTMRENGLRDATVDDPLIEKTDLISFNEYTGWYWGTPDICDSVSFTFKTRKPVVITEFGGGALAGHHGDRKERFTEECMEYLYRKNIEMLENRVQGLCGTAPWVLKDFRSNRRHLTGIQDDYNRKGLISEKGVRKSAFFVMKDWYRTK